MQVKPRFKSYRILEQHPLIKDDAGNQMCLTFFECALNDLDTEISEPYKFWIVCHKNNEQYNNKAVGFDEKAYWKETERTDLYRGKIGRIEIEEVYDGYHTIFDAFKTKGLKTKFLIKCE